MVKIAFLRACLVFFVIASAVLNAQAPTAELTGTIRDATGAVVPDAQVGATNEDTGFTRKVRSNELGYYTVPLLLDLPLFLTQPVKTQNPSKGE